MNRLPRHGQLGETAEHVVSPRFDLKKVEPAQRSGSLASPYVHAYGHRVAHGSCRFFPHSESISSSGTTFRISPYLFLTVY